MVTQVKNGGQWKGALKNLHQKVTNGMKFVISCYLTIEEVRLREKLESTMYKCTERRRAFIKHNRRDDFTHVRDYTGRITSIVILDKRNPILIADLGFYNM